jgi:hypothetical protein
MKKIILQTYKQAYLSTSSLSEVSASLPPFELSKYSNKYGFYTLP